MTSFFYCIFFRFCIIQEEMETQLLNVSLGPNVCFLIYIMRLGYKTHFLIHIGCRRSPSGKQNSSRLVFPTPFCQLPCKVSRISSQCSVKGSQRCSATAIFKLSCSPSFFFCTLLRAGETSATFIALEKQLT